MINSRQINWVEILGLKYTDLEIFVSFNILESLSQLIVIRLHLEVAAHLYKQGFISSVQRGSLQGPDKVPTEVTPDNIATRRLWLGLKYRGTDSVIRKFSLVSKPSCRIHLNKDELKLLAAGRKVRLIKPLQPSELMLIKDNKTKKVLDLAEAVNKGVEGEVLCRIR
ncbi:unnamed protein product [Wickerhamomyces anomalus]